MIIPIAKIASILLQSTTGKKKHFGNPKYEDYLIHHVEERSQRRKKYLARAKKNNQQTERINLGESRVGELLVWGGEN